ncbi:MAG TPA: hypothetical protein VF255_10625 [Solirubrobacterales bacterium]
MNNKIRLLVLTAVSAAVLALPTTASALESLHLEPTPVGAKPVHGVGEVWFSLSEGSTLGCKNVTGSATFSPGGTTGTLSLKFGGCNSGLTCTTPGEATGNIATTVLPFDLVTLPGGKPGVLVTSNSGHFASFKCGFFYSFNLTGGLIGTVTPLCAYTTNDSTVTFTQSGSGVQAHTKVSGTDNIYALSTGSVTLAMSMHWTLTFGQQTTLVCT